MTAAASVVVAGLGARTAVGKVAPTSTAAVRAEISRIADHPFLFDSAGEPLTVAQVSYLEIDLLGTARLDALAGPAVEETLAPLSGLSPGVRATAVVPVFIGLPAVRPGRPLDTAASLSRCVNEQIIRAGLCTGDVRTIETGHSAGMMAIQAGWELIRSGRAELALCGGVESYQEPKTLAWLEANGQIHGADDNPWGFVPGEAAGFVLLTSARVANHLRLPAVIEVPIMATAYETKLIKTNSVCLGEGLTALFRALADGLPATARIDRLICDMNGEPYRADEFGFATARMGEWFRNPEEFDTPATSWGDVGAASGPLFLAMADAATRRRYAPGPLLAAFTSAESGERSGFVARAISAHTR